MSTEKTRGGSAPGRSRNDDRSDTKNPNSGAYTADQANRQQQAKQSKTDSQNRRGK